MESNISSRNTRGTGGVRDGEASAQTPVTHGLRRWETGSAHNRMILGERWAPGPMIGWAGMNPSYASAARTDPTWLAWRGYATRWGFGGQIVVNPHCGRSSDPDDAICALRELANGRNPDLATALDENLEAIRSVAAEPVAWVIGWGDKGAAMDAVWRLHSRFLRALSDGGATRFLAFGLTASGNPKHVLARGKSRIPADAGLYVFDPATRRLGAAVEPSRLIADTETQAAAELEAVNGRLA